MLFNCPQIDGCDCDCKILLGSVSRFCLYVILGIVTLFCKIKDLHEAIGNILDSIYDSCKYIEMRYDGFHYVQLYIFSECANIYTSS